MVNNDSKMPVLNYFEGSYMPENYISFHNFNEVNYPLLSDIFKIKDIFIFSVGDFIMLLGFIYLISLLFGIIYKQLNLKLKYKNGIKN